MLTHQRCLIYCGNDQFFCLELGMPSCAPLLAARAGIFARTESEAGSHTPRFKAASSPGKANQIFFAKTELCQPSALSLMNKAFTRCL